MLASGNVCVKKLVSLMNIFIGSNRYTTQLLFSFLPVPSDINSVDTIIAAFTKAKREKLGKRKLDLSNEEDVSEETQTLPSGSREQSKPNFQSSTNAKRKQKKEAKSDEQSEVRKSKVESENEKKNEKTDSKEDTIDYSKYRGCELFFNLYQMFYFFSIMQNVLGIQAVRAYVFILVV